MTKPKEAMKPHLFKRSGRTVEQSWGICSQICNAIICVGMLYLIGLTCIVAIGISVSTGVYMKSKNPITVPTLAQHRFQEISKDFNKYGKLCEKMTKKFGYVNETQLNIAKGDFEKQSKLLRTLFDPSQILTLTKLKNIIDENKIIDIVTNLATKVFSILTENQMDMLLLSLHNETKRIEQALNDTDVEKIKAQYLNETFELQLKSADFINLMKNKIKNIIQEMAEMDKTQITNKISQFVNTVEMWVSLPPKHQIAMATSIFHNETCELFKIIINMEFIPKVLTFQQIEYMKDLFSAEQLDILQPYKFYDGKNV